MAFQPKYLSFRLLGQLALALLVVVPLVAIGLPLFGLARAYQYVVWRVSPKVQEPAWLVKKGFEGHGGIVPKFHVEGRYRWFSGSMGHLTYDEWAGVLDDEGITGLLTRRAWRFVAFNPMESADAYPKQAAGAPSAWDSQRGE
jgi:hypothetical protein